MRKRYIASAAGAIGVGFTGFMLRNKENRAKLKSGIKNGAGKIKKNNHTDHDVSTFEEAGIPDQAEPKDAAQLENAKMVSEGSQFGVEYYNHVKAEQRDM
ncbi:hypothetical protein [Lentibacillus salinarum]|uniref:Uncharacterized protein n=1 Tax=Lentibacillus salinarum TaxID=446820 RepID=A0ABW3ZPJ9_9BACI